MARNGKSNGRNGGSARDAADTKLLKKAVLWLVEDVRETRRLIAADRREMAKSDAQHEARFAQNEERIAQNERLLVEWKQEHRAEMALFKRVSGIQSKAIIELLKKQSGNNPSDV